MLRVEFDLSDGSVLMTSYKGDITKIEEAIEYYIDRESRKRSDSFIKKMTIKEVDNQ